MKIIRDLKNVKVFTKLSTIVIGNFDGVHLGHQKIIKSLISNSKETDLNSVLILSLIHI